jgi:hypothetical protein
MQTFTFVVVVQENNSLPKVKSVFPVVDYVSWDKSRELNDEVMKKWKDMRAYFGENG